MTFALALLASSLLLTPFFGCCCSTTGTLVVTLRGCNSLPLAGETVTVQLSGVTVASGTTDGSGVASFSLAAGSYTVLTSVARFNASSTSATVTSGVTTSLTVTPTVAAAYFCCGYDCARPLSKTLHFTLGGYSGTFTFSGSSAGYTDNIANANVYHCTTPSFACVCSATSGPSPVQFALTCPSGSGQPFRMQILGGALDGGGGAFRWQDSSSSCAGPIGVDSSIVSPTGGTAYFNLTGTCSLPLSLSATVPSTWTGLSLLGTPVSLDAGADMGLSGPLVVTE